MKKLIPYLFASLFLFFVAAPITAVAVPTQVAAEGEHCETSILGIPPWYRGLMDANCNVKSPDSLGGSDPLSAFIWRIVLNVIQIALAIVAYIAFFFILYGGFMFMTAAGNPARVEKGRKSIFNAVIGLVISLSAIAITNFIFTFVAAPSNVGDIEGVVRMGDAALIGGLLKLVFYIAGLLAVVMIIISGFMYTTSSGDAGKLGKAKSTLTWSVIGLIIVICAYAITEFVTSRF